MASIEDVKSSKPSKGFIWSIISLIFISWIVFKCVPLTEKEQNALIRSHMERERQRLAQEFDRVTDADKARLPEIDYQKYALLKRNGRFWLIPKEYGGGLGFGIRWPDTVNKLLKKKWKDEFNGHYGFGVEMYSRQYNESNSYTSNEFFLNKKPCIDGNYLFVWNGINIRIKNSNFANITNEQYLDVCLTTLKILNEEIKEIHYVK